LSVAVVGGAGLLAGTGSALSAFASVLGATALIFVAKGDVYGQVFTVLFGMLYGVVSYQFRYYGEVITYVGMSAPAAFVTLIAWLKHPYKDTDEVRVSHLTGRKLLIVILSSAAVSVAFYFILGALGNANLLVSTVSVFTSFSACMLLLMRLPYYAIAYAANDVVLIVLWVMASLENLRYLPMVLCFVMFLINDLYGFYNWKRMRKSQTE